MSNIAFLVTVDGIQAFNTTSQLGVPWEASWRADNALLNHSNPLLKSIVAIDEKRGWLYTCVNMGLTAPSVGTLVPVSMENARAGNSLWRLSGDLERQGVPCANNSVLVFPNGGLLVSTPRSLSAYKIEGGPNATVALSWVVPHDGKSDDSSFLASLAVGSSGAIVADRYIFSRKNATDPDKTDPASVANTPSSSKLGPLGIGLLTGGIVSLCGLLALVVLLRRRRARSSELRKDIISADDPSGDPSTSGHSRSVSGSLHSTMAAAGVQPRQSVRSTNSGQSIRSSRSRPSHDRTSGSLVPSKDSLSLGPEDVFYIQAYEQLQQQRQNPSSAHIPAVNLPAEERDTSHAQAVVGSEKNRESMSKDLGAEVGSIGAKTVPEPGTNVNPTMVAPVWQFLGADNKHSSVVSAASDLSSKSDDDDTVLEGGLSIPITEERRLSTTSTVVPLGDGNRMVGKGEEAQGRMEEGNAETRNGHGPGIGEAETSDVDWGAPLPLGRRGSFGSFATVDSAESVPQPPTDSVLVGQRPPSISSHGYTGDFDSLHRFNASSPSLSRSYSVASSGYAAESEYSLGRLKGARAGARTSYSSYMSNSTADTETERSASVREAPRLPEERRTTSPSRASSHIGSFRRAARRRGASFSSRGSVTSPTSDSYATAMEQGDGRSLTSASSEAYATALDSEDAQQRGSNGWTSDENLSYATAPEDEPYSPKQNARWSTATTNTTTDGDGYATAPENNAIPSSHPESSSEGEAAYETAGEEVEPGTRRSMLSDDEDVADVVKDWRLSGHMGPV
ncbi:hypothetical protein HK104_010804 [Borealophlyctis nickersoniae]|nr:hypothetical protein HK104_010804 [Borealophlyctis nickersoniae]